MKMVTADLKEGLRIINTVPMVPGILSSQFIQLTGRGLRVKMLLSGTVVAEATLSVSSKKSEKGEMKFVYYVDRRVLAAFLSGAREDSVGVLLDGKVLVLTCGRARLRVPTQDPIGGYGIWDGKGKHAVIEAAWLREFALLHKYTSAATTGQENFRSVVLLPSFGMYASDSFAVAGVLSNKQKLRLVVPTELASLFKGEAGQASFVVGSSGSAVVFEGKGFVYQLLNRAMEQHPYQRMQELLQQVVRSKSVMTKISAAQLHETLQYLLRFKFDISGVPMVSCDTTGKEVVVALESPDRGAKLGSVEVFSRGVQATVMKAGTFHWPLERLLPWVAHVGALTEEVVIDHKQLGHLQCFVVRAAGKVYVLAISEVLSS